MNSLPQVSAFVPEASRVGVSCYRSSDQFTAYPFQHKTTGLIGAFFPGEYRDGGNAIKLNVPEGRKKCLPVYVTLSDVQVLVHGGRDAWRVDDVTQAR